MSTSPLLLGLDVPQVTVARLRTLYAVSVRGTQASILPSASAATALADRLRAHPEEAAELLEFARRTFGETRARRKR